MILHNYYTSGCRIVYTMKKILIICLSVVLALIVIFLGISAYLGYTLTRVQRVPVTETPAIYNLTYENVSFPSLDSKLMLRGWLLLRMPFSTPLGYQEQIIIMVHGNGQNRVDTGIGTLEIADELVKHGFNVLMFDLRGYGQSDGSMVSGGLHERRDVEGAVDFVKSRGFEDIGVLGFSLGAVSSILAAAEDKDIDALVSDSAFADINDIMIPEFHARTKAPGIFLRPILFMIKIMYGVDFAANRPDAVVAKIAPRPVFFIHGGADMMIPVAEAYKLYQTCDNPFDQLWVVPGASHTRAYKTEPKEYIEKVTDFFYESFK